MLMNADLAVSDHIMLIDADYQPTFSKSAPKKLELRLLYVLSVCPISLSYQSVLSVCPISLSYQSVLSVCPISLSYQSVLPVCPYDMFFMRLLVRRFRQFFCCIPWPSSISEGVPRKRNLDLDHLMMTSSLPNPDFRSAISE
jgi:hypothetical protein